MTKQFHGNSAAPIDAPKMPASGGVNVTPKIAPNPVVTDWRAPTPSRHPALVDSPIGSGMAGIGAVPRSIG